MSTRSKRSSRKSGSRASESVNLKQIRYRMIDIVTEEKLAAIEDERKLAELEAKVEKKMLELEVKERKMQNSAQFEKLKVQSRFRFP